MRRIGHRGAKGHAPDNTIASFQKAIDLACDEVETDVWLMPRGSLVIAHDRPETNDGLLELDQVLDAGDVLSLLHESKVDLMLGGHRHVPYVWPIAGLYVIHSGTVSTLRTRGFGHPSYNLIRIGAEQLEIERRIPGAAGDLLGVYPRRWPPELTAQPPDSFVRRRHGESLADT